MPREPLPSPYDLPNPRSGDGDVVAVGGELEPGLVLQAYRKGLFPMNLPEGELGWWSPLERAIIPEGGLRITKSLSRSVRRFEVTLDRAFTDVMIECAAPDRPGGWITPEFIETYTSLHELGWAHSVEVWNHDGDLVGGLYGISIGGLFAGESMFHRVPDASKVALVHLTVVLSSGDGYLLDVQWLTDHLASLGAVGVGRDTYLNLLRIALEKPNPFPGTRPVDSR